MTQALTLARKKLIFATSDSLRTPITITENLEVEISGPFVHCVDLVTACR